MAAGICRGRVLVVYAFWGRSACRSHFVRVGVADRGAGGAARVGRERVGLVVDALSAFLSISIGRSGFTAVLVGADWQAILVAACVSARTIGVVHAYKLLLARVPGLPGRGGAVGPVI